jgi:hypothetical protein
MVGLVALATCLTSAKPYLCRYIRKDKKKLIHIKTNVGLNQDLTKNQKNLLQIQKYMLFI